MIYSNDYIIAKERFRVAEPGSIVPIYDLNWDEAKRAALDIQTERVHAKPLPISIKELFVEVEYILRAVANKPISSTDSSCAFCEAYGDAPHGQMCDDSEHECVVTTSQRLLALPSDALPSLTDASAQ